ncbi:hypothetical protein [Neobacillus sp. LXY-4]|uniref:hypothetical protein n=1 Tax=Neobacillus sp. LXY-4 TaxID=3379826 RepID=UPI003EDEE8FA
MNTTIRFADRQDTLKVLAYLTKANLGTEGVADSIDYFLLMEDSKGEILATLGIEPCGTIGLLRSLAMSATLKEADILALFNQMYLLAKEKSLSTLYLATNKPDSVSFFQVLGFNLLDSKDVPVELLELNHVQHIFTVDNSFFMQLNL